MLPCIKSNIFVHVYKVSSMFYAMLMIFFFFYFQIMTMCLWRLCRQCGLSKWSISSTVSLWTACRCRPPQKTCFPHFTVKYSSMVIMVPRTQKNHETCILTQIFRWNRDRERKKKKQHLYIKQSQYVTEMKKTAVENIGRNKHFKDLKTMSFRSLRE